MPSLDELKRLGLISEYVTEQSLDEKGFDLCAVAPGYPATDEEIGMVRDLAAEALAACSD